MQCRDWTFHLWRGVMGNHLSPPHSLSFLGQCNQLTRDVILFSSNSAHPLHVLRNERDEVRGRDGLHGATKKTAHGESLTVCHNVSSCVTASHGSKLLSLSLMRWVLLHFHFCRAHVRALREQAEALKYLASAKNRLQPLRLVKVSRHEQDCDQHRKSGDLNNVCSPQPLWSPWSLTFPTYLTSAVGFAKATTSRTKLPMGLNGVFIRALPYCWSFTINYIYIITGLHGCCSLSQFICSLTCECPSSQTTQNANSAPSLPLSLSLCISETLLFRKCKSGPLQAHDVPESSIQINTGPLTQYDPINFMTSGSDPDQSQICYALDRLR